jgi:hypothetical protein
MSSPRWHRVTIPSPTDETRRCLETTFYKRRVSYSKNKTIAIDITILTHWTGRQNTGEVGSSTDVKLASAVGDGDIKGNEI